MTILFPALASALVYDDTEIIDGAPYVTRLDFEKTTKYKCTKSCRKVSKVPSNAPNNAYSLLSGLGAGLPQVVRALQSDDQRFVAAFRSDGKNRVIQIVDLVTRQSYFRTENIPNEILLEETRLLAWSGHHLFYLSDIEGRRAVYRVNADALLSGFGVTKAIGGDFEVADFLPLGENEILYVANTRGTYDWRLYHLKDKSLHEIDRDVSNIARLEKLGDLIFYSKMTEAGFEAYTYDLKTKKTEKLKMPKASNFKDLMSPVMSPKTYAGLPSVLVKPSKPNDGKNLIVWLHGGPHRQTSLVLNPIRSYGTYDATLIRIANETGTPILKVDYPGSIGSGFALANSIYGQVGGIDVDKLGEAIKEVVKELGVENVYMGGTSYGGYLSLKFVAEKPNMVDGILAINPVTDWPLLFESVYGSPLMKLFGTNKASVPQYLWDQADIYKQIETISSDKPIVIAYGSNDTNVPNAQSIIMIHFLKSKGKNVKEVIFKGEGHTIVKKSSVQNFCKEMLKLIGAKSTKCSL